MDEREEIMKKLMVICAFLTVPLAGGGYCAGAEAAGDSSKGAADRELHERRGPAEKMRNGGRFAIIAKVLRLSDSQQAKITEILRSDHEEHAALMKQLVENRKLFREKTHAAAFDEAEVSALAEKQGKLMARMIISPAIVRNKIRTLLTPEQRDLEERIQPLLEPRPEPGPHFAGDEFSHFAGKGMEHRPPVMDEEYPLPMKKGPPSCDED
jgi:Spy/CpxP family protein refolding chaperone